MDVSLALPLRTVVAVFGTLLVSLFGTYMVREWATRSSILDAPNQRSTHSVPVPRLGGIAIALSVLFGVLAMAEVLSIRLLLVLAGAAVMVLAGVLDDIRPMSPLQKYGPQLLASMAASAAIQPDLRIELPYFDQVFTDLEGIIFAAIFITITINVFNFMDGIDGLAGGFGVLAALGIITVCGGSPMILLPVASALAGFLFWNLNPASIFMGDGGSQLIGYLLGVGAISTHQASESLVVTLLIMAPFVFDTGFTLLRRLRHGENVFRAHRSHLYQRAVDAGALQRAVTNTYLAGTSFCILLASSYDRVDDFGRVLLLAFALAVAFASVYIVMRFERAATVPKDCLRTSRQPHIPATSIVKGMGKEFD